MQKKRHKNRISKMKPVELKKLAKKMVKTSVSLQKQLSKQWEEIYKIETSIKKVQQLRKQIVYWQGKRKALKCPAYQHTDNMEGRCGVFSSYEYTMNYLFRFKCSHCKLTKKEALKQATFNGVFGNYGKR